MAYMKVDVRLSESFEVDVGVGQGCVISSWLFSIYIYICMDRAVRENRKRGSKVSFG